MADTRQVVSWSLERKCVFRTGEEWFLPGQTFKQLADLRTVASAESDSRNVRGICVTSWTTEQDNGGKIHEIPSSGFRIDECLGPFGGLSEVLATCLGCEANANNDLAIQAAGCFGYVDVWPDSDELNEQLWNIIEKRNLESRLRSAFPVTTPLWYGFWINSPLQRVQAEFIHELLNAVCDVDDPEDKDVRHFLNALKAAIDWELPVHVSLSPLGHTDLGWYTIFPHCPRCKANAPVGRWKESYPTTPHTCRACDHTFVPNEHHSSERDDVDWDAQSLEKQLGETGYEQFIKDFLIHRGCSLEQATEILDNKNNGPLLRRIAEVRRTRNATLRRVRRGKALGAVEKPPSSLSIALTDDVDLELVLVPAGEFLMGSPPSAEDASESPQHLVQINRPFYIGRFPVTQAQLLAVMGKNTSKHRGDPNLPADQVSWFDCQAFCEELCQRQRQAFRLPCEAEWEYACRAGTASKFAFGETLSPEQANFTPYMDMLRFDPASEEELVTDVERLVEASEQRSTSKALPTPVGSFPPNAWGIYDMHGNVEEWCEDVWHPDYEGAPSDGSAWLEGEEKEPFRVVRGGWCSATESVCASSSRRQLRADAGTHDEEVEDESDDPFMKSLLDLMYTPCGFRVVCEVR